MWNHLCNSPTSGNHTITEHVYERSAIEKWIKEKGTCPQTRTPLTVEDLRFPFHTYTRLIEHCDKNLDVLTGQEKLALEHLRSDYAKDRQLLNALEIKKFAELMAKNEVDAKTISAYFLKLTASLNTNLLPPDTTPEQLLRQAEKPGQSLKLVMTASAATASAQPLATAVAAKPSLGSDHKS
jgi:hypothetical protein